MRKSDKLIFLTRTVSLPDEDVVERREALIGRWVEAAAAVVAATVRPIDLGRDLPDEDVRQLRGVGVVT